MTSVILKKGREESLLRFHPWVFSGAVADIRGNVAEGDLVQVCSAQGEPLALGHYQVGSIAVRVLSFDSSPAQDDFYLQRLGAALELRRQVGLETGAVFSCAAVTNCYRLCHGEGDGLPGLIIDYYDGVCVMQAHSVGMFRAKNRICEALQSLYGDELKAVYDKSSGTAPFKAGLDLIDGYLYRRPDFTAGEITVLENGHRFYVDWEGGQKTGFFLDQRDNRKAVGALSRGKRVLNLFCYTGGFSVYALAAGAESVCSVDSSRRAVDMVERSVALMESKGRHEALCTDAIDFLKNIPEDAYDLMIVDPPAFAKHRGALSNALRAYKRLNAAAISKIAPGGLIFTFSCSQVVDKIAFAEAVFSAAASVGRNVRILDRFNQPADHPVNIYHPEGEYLKGLLLYVE
ncbi:MAG: class I SAM-dependent rRNA methyltransferase [Bacteroidales bacterium]|nr:class I SAM-dependent rRNA methyltransferase [Bacteroidales bacterium]